VFYSEQTEHSYTEADGEAKAHCLHCGKEVHIVTAAHDHDSRTSRTSHTDVKNIYILILQSKIFNNINRYKDVKYY
jgi:hypothetical protein